MLLGYVFNGLNIFYIYFGLIGKECSVNVESMGLILLLWLFLYELL